MSEQPFDIHSYRYSPINVDRIEVLASTDYISQALVDRLTDRLGMMFHDIWDESYYTVGLMVIPDQGDWGPALRAVRHWDGSPGLDIEMFWVEGHPSTELIEHYREMVLAALASLHT